MSIEFYINTNHSSAWYELQQTDTITIMMDSSYSAQIFFAKQKLNARAQPITHTHIYYTSRCTHKTWKQKLHGLHGAPYHQNVLCLRAIWRKHGLYRHSKSSIHIQRLHGTAFHPWLTPHPTPENSVNQSVATKYVQVSSIWPPQTDTNTQHSFPKHHKGKKERKKKFFNSNVKMYS